MVCPLRHRSDSEISTILRCTWGRSDKGHHHSDSNEQKDGLRDAEDSLRDAEQNVLARVGSG